MEGFSTRRSSCLLFQMFGVETFPCFMPRWLPRDSNNAKLGAERIVIPYS